MDTRPLLGFEDPVSSWLHFAGALAFLLLAPRLLYKARESPGRVLSLVVFVAAVVLQLSMSGVYHMLADGEAREVLRRLDHAAIFLLIAGTFTPGHTILFQGWMRWGVLAFVWLVAVGSIAVKTVFFGGFPEWLGLALYIALGWLGAITGVAAWRMYGFKTVAPLLWGGLAYTVGAALDFARWPTLWPGVVEAHDIFHVAVLVGISWHWYFMFRFAHGVWDPLAREG